MHPAPNLTCFICSTRYSQAILEQNPRGLRAINHVMHRALFILIWTQIYALSRELKFWHLISRKKRTLSLKFRSTLILKFISPKKRSCQISKARKLTCLAFCLGPLNPPSCSSSHRGSFLRFKRSYRKSFTLRNAENLLLILPKVWGRCGLKRNLQRGEKSLYFVGCSVGVCDWHRA